MSDIDDIANAVIAEANKHKGLIKAGEALKQLGSLKQALSETETALAKNRDANEQAKADLAASEQALESLKQEQAGLIKGHEDHAKRILATAGDASKTIIEKAKEQAQELIDDALAAMAKVELEQKGKLEAAQQRLADINTQARAAEMTRDAMRLEAKDTEDRIKTMKEAASKVLA